MPKKLLSFLLASLIYFDGIADVYGVVVRTVVSVPPDGEIAAEGRGELEKVKKVVHKKCGRESGKIPTVVLQGIFDAKSENDNEPAALNRAESVRKYYSNDPLMSARSFLVAGSAWTHSLRRAGISEHIASTKWAVYIEAGC